MAGEFCFRNLTKERPSHKGWAAQRFHLLMASMNELEDSTIVSELWEMIMFALDHDIYITETLCPPYCQVLPKEDKISDTFNSSRKLGYGGLNVGFWEMQARPVRIKKKLGGGGQEWISGDVGRALTLWAA